MKELMSITSEIKMLKDEDLLELTRDCFKQPEDSVYLERMRNKYNRFYSEQEIVNIVLNTVLNELCTRFTDIISLLMLKRSYKFVNPEYLCKQYFG